MIGRAFLWTNHPDAKYVKLVHPETVATTVEAVEVIRVGGMASRCVDVDYGELPLMAVFSADQAGEDVVAAQPVVHPEETPISGSFVFNGPAVVNLSQSGS
jgi:hypothetical protein